MHTQQNSYLHFLQVIWLLFEKSKREKDVLRSVNTTFRGGGEHSLASSILLDRTLALATLLRITFDPIRRLAIILTLLQPHLGNTANHRSVIGIDRAPEAELV